MKKVRKTKPQSRFMTVAPGIRYDSQSDTFVASRSIDGKRKSKTFPSLQEAKMWREMDESLVENEGFPVSQSDSMSTPPLAMGMHYPVQNGVDRGLTVLDVYNMYYEEHVVDLEYASRTSVQDRLRTFLEGLENLKIVDITARRLDQHLRSKKQRAIANNSQRYSFDEELKKFKAMCNWYRDFHDEYFNQPVMKRHKKLGRIKKRPPKKKKMTMDQVLDFFDGFAKCMTEIDLFWQDIAKMQFAITGRIQEALVIHLKDIDMETNEIHIRHAGVWDRNSKKLVEIKGCKNGEERDVTITPMMKEIIERQLKRLPKNAKFLFQVDTDEKVPRYKEAQYRYNKALRKAGLDKEFRSTHIMRHASAKAVMDVTGSLEAVQSCTGHSDREQAQHYAGKPTSLQAGAANQVEREMKKLQKKRKKN